MARRVNTRRAYDSHYRQFLELAQVLGYSHSVVKPMTEYEWAALLIAYARNHKMTSLGSFMTGVAASVNDLHLPLLPSTSLIDRTLQGLKQFYSGDPVKRAIAITLKDIFQIRTQLDLSSYDDCRDYLAYLLAFFGTMRISEYTGNSSLLWKHVRLHTTSTGAMAIVLTLPFSKTSSVPEEITIIEQTHNRSICPITTFIQFQSLSGHRLPDSPLFTKSISSFEGISPNTFISNFRKRLQRIDGRLTEGYSGHSFRRGGLTALILAGVPEIQAQRHGRWSSDAYKQYLDGINIEAIRLAPTAALNNPNVNFNSHQ